MSRARIDVPIWWEVLGGDEGGFRREDFCSICLPGRHFLEKRREKREES